MTKNKNNGNGLRESDPELDSERDPKSGQFVVGHTGIGGRPKGSRDRLGQAFIEDVFSKWRKHGTAVLDAVIRDKPHEFLKIVAGILPKQLDETLRLDISLEAADFDANYRLVLQAMRHIGANTKLIEADGSDESDD